MYLYDSSGMTAVCMLSPFFNVPMTFAKLSMTYIVKLDGCRHLRWSCGTLTLHLEKRKMNPRSVDNELQTHQIFQKIKYELQINK